LALRGVGRGVTPASRHDFVDEFGALGWLIVATRGISPRQIDGIIERELPT
jgi:hypothetical protein